MPRLTYNRYVHSGEHLTQFSLTARYQEAENYRSSKVLEKVIYILGGTTIFTEGAFLIAQYLLDGLALEIVKNLAIISLVLQVKK